VRIERIAAECDNEEDARLFQEPMTSAWEYYVSSNQFLSELRGLTRNYPICGDIVYDAQLRVRSDPESNRSWNLAWLCLRKIKDEWVLPLLSFCTLYPLSSFSCLLFLVSPRAPF